MFLNILGTISVPFLVKTIFFENIFSNKPRHTWLIAQIVPANLSYSSLAWLASC